MLLIKVNIATEATYDSSNLSLKIHDKLSMDDFNEEITWLSISLS